MIHEDCVRVKSKFVKGNYYIRKSGVKEKIWKLRRNREREREREFNSQRKMITFCWSTLVVRREVLTSFHFASFAFILFLPFSPTPTSPSASSPANQPLCPVFHFPVYSCVLDHLCVSECCLRSYCSYVPRKCTTRPSFSPSSQSRQRGREGYLDSGKVRGVFRTRVNFALFSAFLFFFFLNWPFSSVNIIRFGEGKTLLHENSVD